MNVVVVGNHIPSNIYCPNVRNPPVIPGECRSCGTTTREHANDCQYVAIKDNIGFMHLFAKPKITGMQLVLSEQQIRRWLQERRERNKKNTKKGGKVKIIAGIMTREQESDSTISSEKEEGGVKTPSPQRLEGRHGYQRPLHGGYVPQPVITPREVMCSLLWG